MSLRRKLFLALGVLGLLAVAIVGVTLWSGERREDADARLEGHYQRSLLLQEIRGTTFRALKEVPDALQGGDAGARREFEALLVPVETDFRQWSDLADTPTERNEVRQVRDAYDDLVAGAREVFALIERGRIAGAARLSEGRLEDRDLVRFERLTDAAVAEDRRKRGVVRATSADVRRAGQIILLVAAFGTVSVTLLLLAYLSADLFAPLRRLRSALDDLGRGDLTQRLPEDRADELGAANAAFNRMAAAIAGRERAAALPSAGSDGRSGDGDGLEEPSRLVLHRLVGQARGTIAQLGEDGGTEAERAAAAAELDRLMHAVSRLTELGFPLDLTLERTDVPTLLYEVMLRFRDDYIARGVSIELAIDPRVRRAVIDRLKIREVLSELLRNAVDALPDRDGQIGLRASLDDTTEELVIEVADNGEGIDEPIGALMGGGVAEGGARSTGLPFTKAIVERHGGTIRLSSDPGEGTHVQIRLPLRDGTGREREESPR